MTVRWRSGLLALTVAGVLSGCAGSRDENGYTPAIDDSLVDYCTRAEKARDPSACPPEGPIDSHTLIGLEKPALARVLGTPDFQRTDGPSDWQQYRNGRCVLHVFLYRKGDSPRYAVRYIESFDRNMTPMPEDACLAEVMSHRRPVKRG